MGSTIYIVAATFLPQHQFSVLYTISIDVTAGRISPLWYQTFQELIKILNFWKGYKILEVLKIYRRKRMIEDVIEVSDIFEGD